MSKITHPVRVRTRIQAVAAPGGSCGAPRQEAGLGSTSTAGQDVAVKRKKRVQIRVGKGTGAESQSSFSSTT